MNSLFSEYLMEIFREEWINEYMFVEYKSFSLNKPSVMVLALPDVGLVGVIAVSYMINKMGLEEIGGIDSPYLHPVTIIYKGVPRPPIRIFAKDRIIVVYTEIPLSLKASIRFITAVIDYARLKGIDWIIGITGLPIHNRIDVDDLSTYYISPSEEIGKIFSESGIKLLEQGVLSGPYAILIKEVSRKRIPGALLMSESFMEFPDPEAAAKVLLSLGKVLGIQIDVSKLIEQAEIIKMRAREHMRNLMQSFAQLRKNVEYSAPLYT